MSVESSSGHIVQLSAKDFDKTIALTSEPAPNGMTLELAYEGAVERVLGNTAVEIYRVNGLKNRAPGEVVEGLAPTLSPEDKRQRTEDLVEAKLDLIFPNVGTRFPDREIWPRATFGFANICRAEYVDPRINTAVVSSGHTNFISRFFDVHDLPQPDILVTDDDMRPLTIHLPADLCVKPGRLILDLAHQLWLEKLGLESTYENIAATRERIVYTGDDLIKDGQLAANTGVRFVHFDPEQPRASWSAYLEELHSNYEPLSRVDNV